MQQLARYCFKLVKDDDGVKDILQEVYANLYLRRKELPEDLNVIGYLTNAIKYQAAHIIRHQLVRQSYSQLMESASTIAEEQAAEQVEYQELYSRFGQTLETLPEKCRTAFVLNKLEDKNYKAVSEKMGISVKTVEKHISKALKLLRTELSDVRSIFPFL